LKTAFYKTGDIADVINYRAIAISNAESKLLENVILQCTQSSRNDVDCYQFGFKKAIPLDCVRML